MQNQDAEPHNHPEVSSARTCPTVLLNKEQVMGYSLGGAAKSKHPVGAWGWLEGPFGSLEYLLVVPL